MTELTATEIHHLLQQFPKTELSYETNSHKKGNIADDYGLCIAIPNGKKCFAWFTYCGEHDVCYIMEMNREKKIARVIKYIPLPPVFDRGAMTPHLGTILYGTLLDASTPTIFVLEDAFEYAGLNLRQSRMRERLSYVGAFLQGGSRLNSLHFGLPVLWERGLGCDNLASGEEELYMIPEKWVGRIGYPVHHIQYRCMKKTAPYINILPAMSASPLVAIKNFGTGITKGITNMKVSHKGLSNDSTKELAAHSATEVIPTYDGPIIYKSLFRPDFRRPQYKMPTVFLVQADIQYDIYRLFAFGKNKTREYYGIAYISNYAKSVFMNSIFRKIKENGRLDAIEESDDEEEFEDIREDRFVDLGKEVLMEFVFLTKFRKWSPVRVVDGSHKIVHINQLV